MEEKRELERDEVLEDLKEDGTTDNSTEEMVEEVEENNEDVVEENKEEDTLSMVRKLKDDNKKLDNEVSALKDRLMRLSAEYDNFRKRTSKEKEGIYTDACVDVLKELIPVLDNLERAIAVDGNVEDLKKGIEMTIQGFQNSLGKLGVEEINTSEGFDPNLHQAVMHIQDENFEKNSVAEVFLKGYKRNDKVIRHTMVKVAN